jgi:hypothetical protein
MIEKRARELERGAAVRDSMLFILASVITTSSQHHCSIHDTMCCVWIWVLVGERKEGAFTSSHKTRGHIPLRGNAFYILSPIPPLLPLVLIDIMAWIVDYKYSRYCTCTRLL